jgi:hypothetical protein
MVEFKDRIEDIKYNLDNLGSDFMPSQKHIANLFQIYKELNPRENPCMTCRGDRKNVVKWFKQKYKKWQTDL